MVGEKDVKPVIEKVRWCPSNSRYVQNNFDGSFIRQKEWSLRFCCGGS